MKEINAATCLFECFGFLIKWEKFVVEPEQRIEYLGLLMDSLLFFFSLPNKKVDKVIDMYSSALAAGYISLQVVASI